MAHFPPLGTTCESAKAVFSLSSFSAERYHCPACDLMKARSMSPPLPNEWRWERLYDFPGGIVMDALDEIEFGTRRRARRVHEGVRAWISHAVAAYVEACPMEPSADGSPLQAVSPWLYRYHFPQDAAGPVRKLELKAWARYYASADGEVRELRLIVNRLGRRTRSDRERAVAAMIAAEGEPSPRPRSVRVREVGLLEAKSRVVYEGDHDEAVALYRKFGAPAVSQSLRTDEYRVGSACIKCHFTGACPVLPHADGLTGMSNRLRPRRSWSVTNGRSYVLCPARDHFHRLNLPTEDGLQYSADAERGRAIHDFLARRHTAGLSCPSHVPEGWVPEGYDLSEDDRMLGVQLLRHHAEVCPLGHATAADMRIEQEWFFEDRHANVLVVAKPDLLYRDGGGWVWREVKSHRTSWSRQGSLLADVPQLALAVLILHRGDLGGTRRLSRAELETLRPGGADLEIVDPHDPATIAEARRVVHEMIAPWHADDVFAAAPGPHCGRCDVARWCPSRLEPQGDE